MNSLSEQHIIKSRNQIKSIIFLGASTFILALIAMGQGSYEKLDVWTTAKMIFGLETPTKTENSIIWSIRFPRILMAVVGGVALAIAGALMQGCLGNPLVSPLTLGVASGAALGAAVAIMLGFSVIGGPLAIVGNAFLFALIVVFIIIQLGSMHSVSAESYILVGIAITFIAGAITSILNYFATDEQVSQLMHWSFGSLGRVDRETALLLTFSLIYLLPLTLKWSWDLNALSIGGDEFAISTGVDPVGFRRTVLVLSAFLTALVISFTGLIGFVGLAAPHMARVIVGNDFRKLIPSSAIFGAFLMLFADTLGRTLFAPVIIPVGVMLSVIGGPFFLYLLIRSKER